MLRALLSGLLDLLSPPACAACSAPIDARVHGFCAACGLLVEPALSASAYDLDACLYGGPLRDALHRLKYEGASELAPALAEWLQEPARRLLGKLDCVAVVPLHPRRLRARGYNQSALLARPVARLLSVPFVPGLLRRTRDTPKQAALRRSERQAQLEGAFVATHHVRGQRVLVIDDVRTTGATFAEARRALLAADARLVCTLALAVADTDAESAASGL